MRTQLIICAFAVAFLFACGMLTLSCALQIRRSVENERTSIVATRNGITSENLSAGSGLLDYLTH